MNAKKSLYDIDYKVRDGESTYHNVEKFYGTMGQAWTHAKKVLMTYFGEGQTKYDAFEEVAWEEPFGQRAAEIEHIDHSEVIHAVTSKGMVKLSVCYKVIK